MRTKETQNIYTRSKKIRRKTKKKKIQKALSDIFFKGVFPFLAHSSIVLRLCTSILLFYDPFFSLRPPSAFLGTYSSENIIFLWCFGVVRIVFAQFHAFSINVKVQNVCKNSSPSLLRQVRSISYRQREENNGISHSTETICKRETENENNFANGQFRFHLKVVFSPLSTPTFSKSRKTLQNFP